MDTVSLTGLQSQLDDLQKRVTSLEQKRVPRPRATLISLSSEQEQKAIAQILPILLKSPEKLMSSRQISQQNSLLRRLGTKPIRAYLDAHPELFLKVGFGATAQYRIKL